MRDNILGAVLLGIAAYIASGWLLCRILGVAHREMEDPLDFEKYKQKEEK